MIPDIVFVGHTEAYVCHGPVLSVLRSPSRPDCDIFCRLFTGEYSYNALRRLALIYGYRGRRKPVGPVVAHPHDRAPEIVSGMIGARFYNYSVEVPGLVEFYQQLRAVRGLCGGGLPVCVHVVCGQPVFCHGVASIRCNIVSIGVRRGDVYYEIVVNFTRTEGRHPALLHQPAAEVGAAQGYPLILLVIDVLSACVQH